MEPRCRARDLGIAPGIFRPGAWNAITDVAGVRVGHVTLVEGDRIRTGATAVLPHGGNLVRDRVPAGLDVLNGYGKFAGATQIEELGEIETPVVLTNTLPIPADHRFDRLTVLSIAPMLARAIHEVFEDGSVTSLFEG